MNSKDSKETVTSPANSLGETIANCDGMPPKMDVDAIFAENTPPNQPAKNSTVGMGSKGGGN